MSGTKGRRHRIVTVSPLRYLLVLSGAAAALIGFLWYFGLGSGSGYAPSYAWGQILKLVALVAAGVGVAAIAFWVAPSMIRNRFAYLVGDLGELRWLNMIGARGAVLDGDLSDVELVVEDLGRIKVGRGIGSSSQRRARFTIRGSAGSISQHVNSWVTADEHEERFAEWKRDWLAHNQPGNGHD